MQEQNVDTEHRTYLKKTNTWGQGVFHIKQLQNLLHGVLSLGAKDATINAIWYIKPWDSWRVMIL